MPRLLLDEVAIADGTADSLLLAQSLAIDDGRIAWIGPKEGADRSAAEIVDAGGATLVPAMVDCHSHLTLQGGSHWNARGSDPPDVLRQVARDNARRLTSAGVLWARDVGAPIADGAPLSLAAREELADQPGMPYIRVAGTWIGKTGFPALWVTVEGAQLKDAALAQLDLGTDLVKVYMDSPGWLAGGCLRGRGPARDRRSGARPAARASPRTRRISTGPASLRRPARRPAVRPERALTRVGCLPARHARA